MILFAALSYAVTQSTRGGGNNASAETIGSQTAALMQYGTLVENIVGRLRLSGGCSDTQISFENQSVTGYANSTAPVDKHCHVFDAAGGGASLMALPVAWLDSSNSAVTRYGYPFFNGRTDVNGVGQYNGTGAKSVELLMLVPFIKREICLEINCKVGLGTCGSTPYYSNNPKTVDAEIFDGSYSMAVLFTDGFPPRFPVGCVRMNNFNYGAYPMPADAYLYYHTLIAR